MEPETETDLKPENSDHEMTGSDHSPTDTKKPDPKGNPPKVFDGNRDNLESFIFNTEMYLELKADHYANDKQKIIFMITYMDGGTAGPWRQDWWATNKRAVTDGTIKFEQFVEAVKKAFSQYDAPNNALLKMEEGRMSNYKDCDDYTQNFKIWKRDSGIQEDITLINYYKKGLVPSLRDKIANSETPPTTFAGWMEKALAADGNYKLHKSWTQVFGNKGKDQSKKPWKPSHHPTPRYTSHTSHTTTTRDPNAMDIDRLSVEQRDEHFKMGKCFNCHQKGHRAAECPERNNAPKTYSAPPKYRTATAAYTHIKALLGDLPEAEREKFLEEADKNGLGF